MAAEAGRARDEVQEELGSMDREFEWLLAEELPLVFMQLGRSLKECTTALVAEAEAAGPKPSTPLASTPRGRRDLLSRVGSPGPDGIARPPSRSQSKPLARLVSDDNSIDGAVQLVGVKLVQGKLAFRIPKTSKSVAINCRVDIVPTAPLLVRQIQAVLNSMKLTLLGIEETLQHQHLKTSREQLLNVTSRLLGYLMHAKGSIVVADRKLPEHCIAETSLLSPSPPDNLIVETHVANAQLVMTAYVIAELPGSPPANYMEVNRSLRPKGSVGHIFKYSGRWCEVTMIREARGDHALLQSTYRKLQAMVELAQQMQEKLLVFRRSTR